VFYASTISLPALRSQVGCSIFIQGPANSVPYPIGRSGWGIVGVVQAGAVVHFAVHLLGAVLEGHLLLDEFCF
jgi:hypothetical protein